MHQVLAVVADPIAARSQMGLSLGWHIIIACFGVGLPALVVFAEWRGQVTHDPVYMLLARRWAKALGVLFAIGAVSGTILSIELGVLWSGLMSKWGEVMGLPFAIEGIAFFIEAIFLGIYLYGWDKLPPTLHLLSGIPIFIAGLLSAFFVVCANAWMNTPTGYIIADGRLASVNPWAAMFNLATWPETIHMILAALMVTGFGTASVYAVAILRGRRDRYHQLGLTIPLVGASICAPIQIGVGDWAAEMVAHYQATKLAALEALSRTTKGAREALFGWYSHGHLRYAIDIPHGLSLLATHSYNGTVQGLDATPKAYRPPLVNVVHLSFDFMVFIGFGLLGIGLWLGLAWWLKRQLPKSRWFLRSVAVSGIAAAVAMELGWVTTEVGRQPWIVYKVMLVAQAVNPEPGVSVGAFVIAAAYTALTIITILVLRHLAHIPIPTEPSPQDVEAYRVA